ncbi:MAG: hypothetical protein M1510_11860 [Nitrospirae bacterium]|nr:hypothetical protein [Nitrospirota bacterium]
MKEITPEGIRHFRKVVYQYYRKHGRNNLPWRNTDNPYHILVSEIMLQQTQVERVTAKYAQFIAAFPDFSSLSRATLREVLAVWQAQRDDPKNHSRASEYFPERNGGEAG